MNYNLVQRRGLGSEAIRLHRVRRSIEEKKSDGDTTSAEWIGLILTLAIYVLANAVLLELCLGAAPHIGMHTLR